jgi:exodeoxyribonuclease III
MPKRFLVAIAAAAAFATGALFAASCGSEDESTLTVMSYNIWGGGANESKPIDETVAAIEKVDADIVGVQETQLEGKNCTANKCPPKGSSVAKELADALGYDYYEQAETNDALWANAILSRYPIGGATQNDLGVEIDVDGRAVYAFNVHLDDSPYQPYQLLDIAYGGAPFIKTEAEAVRFANQTRGPAIELLKQDLGEAEVAAAAFVFGDFNEPSAHDWTQAAVAAGQQPLEVAWPTTRSIEQLGFVDTYREVHPDPAEKPAFTWTPTSSPSVRWDHHDRIDFVLARGDGLNVKDAAIVGEKRPQAEIVVKPWPSDHRAAAATVEF